jgi:hypothetical protein
MMKRKILAAAVTLAVAGAGAGVASATIPSSSGNVYHACVNNTGPLHSVYMIDKDKGESCFAGYTEKTWNQTGPAGPAGPQGPQGDPGSLATVQVTAYDTAPTGTTNNYHYHPVATCPTGYVATGGGWADSMLAFANPTVGDAGPTTDGRGWQGHALYFADTRTDIGVTVICSPGTTS